MAERHGRFGAALQLVVVVAFEAAAVVALARLGSIERWEVDWAHLGGWVQAVQLEDAIAGLLRWGGLVLAAWLLASTVLYSLARLSRVPALIRGTQWAALPPVRALVDRAAVAAVAASSVVSVAQAAPAWAHAPPAAATALASSGGAVVPPGPLLAAFVVADPPAAMNGSVGHSAAGSVDPSQPAEWEVHSGDNLWDISAAHVGKASGRSGAEVPDAEVAPYWRQVCEINRGTLRSGHPGLIHPGERIVLPPTMAPAPPPEASPGSTTPPAHQAPAPDQERPVPTTVTAQAQDTAAPEAPPSPAPAASAPTTRPAVTAGAGVPSGELRSSVSPSPVAAGRAGEVPTRVPSPARAGRGRGWEFPHIKLSGPGLAGAGLMAAGAVGALDRLIRARSRRGRTKDVDLALAGSELALRVGADSEAATFLDLALRAMAAGLRDAGRELPEVLGAELGPRQLEIILAEASAPAPAPPGFSTTDGGRRWVMPRRTDRAELEDLAWPMPAPCPALVTVGRNGAGGWVLVDLEQAGATAIVGDRAMAGEVLAAATVELATSEWADFVQVVLVGHDLATQERVRSVDSLEEVIDELERTAAAIGAQLAHAGCASSLEARVRGKVDEVGDAWIPTLVLCAEPPPAHLAGRLTALATTAGNAGVGVLVAGPLEGAWELVAGPDDQLSVGVLDGAVVTAQHLSPAEASAVSTLFTRAGGLYQGGTAALAEFDMMTEEERSVFPDYLDHGDDIDDVVDEASERPAGEGDDHDQDDVAVESSPTPVGPPPGLPLQLRDLELLRDLDMLVGVLGPVRVWGSHEPLDRGKSLELVLYLLLNPCSAIDARRLMDALWPGWELKECPPGKRPPVYSTFNTTVSVARRCLGESSTGGLRFPLLQGNGTRNYGLLRVPLDYQLLRNAIVEARSADRCSDRRTVKSELRGGLALVRGRPLDDLRDKSDRCQWANVSGAIRAMEREVCQAAHWLATLCLEDHDADGARWAAGQGLLAVPGHRALVCAEMKAAALERNPAGVEGAMHELTVLLDDDVPHDPMDAETLAVYREQLAIALRPEAPGSLAS